MAGDTAALCDILLYTCGNMAPPQLKYFVIIIVEPHRRARLSRCGLHLSLNGILLPKVHFSISSVLRLKLVKSFLIENTLTSR